MKKDDNMLTVDQVAKGLQVHPQSVNCWIYEGRLKALKIDGIVRITKEEYRRFKRKYMIFGRGV